jgi:signal peptidase I
MPEAEPTIASTPAETTAASRPMVTTGSGIKDTIESILVAFILAFVFRAFVVEAFVIPTGSMATTLLGAHTRFHCPDCGYDFDVNYSPPPSPNRSDPEAEDPAIPPTAGKLTNPIYCPNCGFQMPTEQVDNPPVSYGDRILVLKYLYLLQHPKRWDVVVFKAPIDLPTNYIKRLIGTPGETIEILDGDIYVKEPGSNDFVVQTKPKAVQDALWRLVYDNDYHPQTTLDRGELHAWTQPWTVVDGTGWKLDDPAAHGRTFEFNADNASSRLRFSPIANPTAQTTSDYLVYDQQSPSGIPVRQIDTRYPVEPMRMGYTASEEMPVSDLDLRASYQRQSGSGPFDLTLRKRDHAFVAEITPSQATLFHEFGGKRVQIGQPMQLDSSSRPLRIELSNADYQVILRIDDHIVAQTTPTDYAPNLPELRREFDAKMTPPPGAAEIMAANQHCSISHVSLRRDGFYYNDRAGVRRATPTNPMHLGTDEYFCMGDNSLLSYDGRCWNGGVDLPAEQLHAEDGVVPGRFLLGKAFYVYWPAGYSATSYLPAFVPNFGSMRFIH